MSDGGEEKSAANLPLPRGLRVLLVNVRPPQQARLVLDHLTAWGTAGEAVDDINQALILLQDAAAVGKAYHVAIVSLPIGVFGADAFEQIISHSVGARQTKYILLTTPDQVPGRDELAASVYCAAIVRPITSAKLGDAMLVALRAARKPAPRPPAEPAIENPLFPPIDVDEVVKRCDDDVAAMSGLLERFHAQAGETIEQMVIGLRSRDAGCVARSAHALMDAASTVTARGIHNAAATIQRLGSVEDFAAVHEQIHHLRDELERLKNFVREQARSRKV